MNRCYHCSLNFADGCFKRTSLTVDVVNLLVKRMNELDTMKAIADPPHLHYPLLLHFSLYPILVLEIAQL